MCPKMERNDFRHLGILTIRNSTFKNILTITQFFFSEQKHLKSLIYFTFKYDFLKNKVQKSVRCTPF